MDITGNIELDNFDEIIEGELSNEASIEGELQAENSLEGSLEIPFEIREKNYENLINRPRIEGVELIGDKSFADLNLFNITPQEIDEIIYGG